MRVLPAARHLRLDGHCLERVDTVDRLDQESLILGAAVDLLVQARAQQRRDGQRQPR